MQNYCVQRSLTAVAGAVFALVASQPARAVVQVTGSFFTSPGNFGIGPGNTDIGVASLGIGSGSAGSLTVNGGSLFDMGELLLATGGTGSATGVLDGAGSRIRLRADGNHNRFEVGSWGSAVFTVSGGAELDGRFNATACTTGAQFCNNFVGQTAGADATFTVTGAGSKASFLKDFVVGAIDVFRPPVDSFTFGTPGGVSIGRVNVLNGASLTTDQVVLARGPGGGFPAGTERSFAYATISGPGSIWNVTGGTVNGSTASMVTASHANATAAINISNGGVLNLQLVPNTTHFINLSSGAGKTDMVVSGAGSAVNLNGGVLQVGRGLNGTARLDVTAGGVVNDAYYFSVGRGGSNGRLVLDDTGSRITVNRSAVPGSPDALQGFTGAFDIGRDGGIGVAEITNGGRVEVLSGAGATERARTARLGVGAASQGTLNISGTDSRFIMNAVSQVPGGGPTEVFNPYFSVGYEGAGSLNLSSGAKILMNGGAVSTVADGRSTNFYVGGRDDTNIGGQGFATMTGAGTELRLTGSDPVISVGRGPGSSGQLTVSSGALASTTSFLVGRAGGVGILNIDNATVRSIGQQTGNNLSGASVTVGSGVGSTGVLNMSNNALIDIKNSGGTVGVSFNLGGSGTASGGDGVLQMNSGSRIQLAGPTPDAATVTIGREGAAFARLKGASSIDVGAGNLYVGRFSGGDGTLIASENSSITAGWVGVGRNKTATGSVDGGTGTFILNNATLNAVDVVIGTNGFLGGTAGSIRVSGSVTNYGIFSPGNSPGSFAIDGNFNAGAGSRLVLEVQADGSGGFVTDQVSFSEGAALDFGTMLVEFRFLGNTNPNAFQAAGGFKIDTFLTHQTASGNVALNPALLGGATFTAQADAYTFANFTFSAATGANFLATPVPEPGSWAMMLAGAAALLRLARRRATAQRSAERDLN
jgi:hypothetical protein